MHAPQPYTPTPRPAPSAAPTATRPTPSAAPQPLPVPTPAPEADSSGAALAPRVLTVDEVAGTVTRRPDTYGVAALMPVGRPDSPRAARRFAQTAEAVARGWSHLSHAAVAQANARNTAALSIQRAAEIGAAARKACDDAALHHAKTLDEIDDLRDRAVLRQATREERLQTALLQARIERARLTGDAAEGAERTAAAAAQHRLAVAASELERTRLLTESQRLQWIATEDTRLEVLGTELRSAAFLEELRLRYERVVRERGVLREQAARTRLETLQARGPAFTPDGTSPDTEGGIEALLATLGTAETRTELRGFLLPAIHGIDASHPLAALVRLVYRRRTALDGRPMLDAIREAALAALPFLAKPREEWPADLVTSARARLEALDVEIAAKETRDLRAVLDREESFFHGTEPAGAVAF